MGDFLADMTNGAELTGLFAYLRQDDEMQALRTAYAIAKAFNGGKQSGKAHDLDEDEEVIDTTAPGFAENFKGFTNTKPQIQRNIPNQHMAGTQILMG